MSQYPFAAWSPHLALGITGHRPNNPTFSANEQSITAALTQVFSTIDQMCRDTLRDAPEDKAHPIRLHSLLAQGIDQIAAQIAIDKKWKLVAPLPFGFGLNLAIGAEAATAADAKALIDGGRAKDTRVEQSAAQIRKLCAHADTFAIADQDAKISDLFLHSLENPDDALINDQMQALIADSCALAGKVMLERSDLLIAVWDRKQSNLIGGTGHTIATSLANGIPVLLIDISADNAWSILTLPEELGHHKAPDNAAEELARLRSIIEAVLEPTEDGLKALEKEKWRPKSFFGSGVYRWTERVFGGRTIRSGTISKAYEEPEDIAQGSAADLIASAKGLLGKDTDAADPIGKELLPTFAWFDGISSRLSDAYRSGMVINFALSAFAIIAGIAYLPFDLAKQKWIFASVELGLLLTILLITFAGSRRGWHRRWFQTRRAAEYLRHGPTLIVTGVSRPAGRWPSGEISDWPERYSRDLLRDAGLPNVEVKRGYLRTALGEIVLPHVQRQREYHEAKSRQLKRAHNRIDRSADICFLAAFVSVSIYLGIELAAALGALPADLPYMIAKPFTFLGVALPTLGANLAGMRYFGDFERFASISNVTARKLSNIETRIDLLLSGDPERLTYSATSGVVNTLDETVIEEIASWQSVFSAKHIALPA